jgi:hypothetical protein
MKKYFTGLGAVLTAICVAYTTPKMNALDLCSLRLRVIF